MTWDNVQILEETRHQSMIKENKFHMWAMAFAVKNRVDFMNVESVGSTMQPINIPLSTFMPTHRDYDAGIKLSKHFLL